MGYNMMRGITPEEICNKLRPVFGKKIDALYLKFKLASDIDTKREIEQKMNVLYEKYLNTTLLAEEIHLEPPAKEIIKGEYPLGNISYAKSELYQFGLREKDWPRHVCITGMSGSGKTNFAFQVIANFIQKDKPFVLFDWKKSFRPLMLLEPEMKVYTVGNAAVSNHFKININKPPTGVDPREWVNLLADLIVESFYASFGVHKLLVEVLDKAFKDFGVYNGSNNYPTWKQIKDRLEERASDSNSKSRREGEWMESALRIAHSLTFGNFGDAINYKGENEIEVSDLLDEKILFELHSLNNAEKKFFCEFLLTYIYKLKKASSEASTEKFKSAIVVDEAHNIFLKDKTSFLKESVVDMVYREIREYGVSLICLDQHISKLSDTVTGNSATHIAFQQILADDVDCVSSIMQMRENKKYYSMLAVGEAIVLQAGRYYNPFLIRVPLIDLKSKSVSNDDIKERMTKIMKEYRKNSVFAKAVERARVEKKISQLTAAFKLSGVVPTDEFLDSQLKIMNEAQEAVDYKPPKPSNTRNHLQLELVDKVKQSLLTGNELKSIKAWLISAGYKRTDIKRAIDNVLDKNKGIIDAEA